MYRMRVVACMASMGACLVGSAGLMALPADIIDQSQEQITYDMAIPYYSPMGQSFVPSLSGLDFVELKMDDNTTAPTDGSAQVRIRENSIVGTIIGTSESVFLEDCFNHPEGPGCGIAGGYDVVVRFDFLATVGLTPGATYVLEVVPLESSFGIGHIRSDTYPSGTMIASGAVEATWDMWFREGIVPEPSTLLMMLFVGGGVLGWRRA